ncbi:unnamed protein product [Dovyalis caffra]|uniref:Uncharacterized protein n=1 Tax=Dovyalis caffra TaxID=77055 RepID=A0AAV1RR43_9ROSI|nr:unnamed protein product [Dovyalis caffra]
MARTSQPPCEVPQKEEEEKKKISGSQRLSPGPSLIKELLSNPPLNRATLA